jgi:hypothetical protein
MERIMENAKQDIMDLLDKALAKLELLTVDEYTSDSSEAEDAFGEMRCAIERAIETINYYGD